MQEKDVAALTSSMSDYKRFKMRKEKTLMQEISRTASKI